MAISRIDILNHVFNRSLRGYNPDEVDHLLQEAADALGELSEEKAALQKRVADLEGRLAEFREREAALRDTLVTTQRMTEEIKSAAQREAQLVIDAAHAKAENLINQGNLRLARIQEDIAAARKVKAQVIMRIQAVLDQHQTMIDLEEEEDATQAQHEAATRARNPQGGRHG